MEPYFEGYFKEQHYYAHLPQRDRDDIENEFDFSFEGCKVDEIGKKKSISGIIVCKKKSLILSKVSAYGVYN